MIQITVYGNPAPRYGLLTVISQADSHVTPNGTIFKRVLCRCDCGTEKVIRLSELARKDSKKTVTCGMRCPLKKHGTPPVNLIHGMARRGSNDYLYTVWEHIKSRCFNSRDEYYHAYGARGITLYASWVTDPAAFAAYILNKLGERPTGCSIDRIDNNGSYVPGNLRWATALEQSLNTRRNRYIVAFGEELTISEWARRCGRTSMCIHSRIKRGQSPEEALREAVQ